MASIAIPGDFDLGGPRSFQVKLTEGLRRRGLEVRHDWEPSGLDAVLLIGGTRNLAAVLRYKRRGVPIVQRLDGINWIHRARWQGLRRYLQAESRNHLMFVVHRHAADFTVYQSEFVRSWWSDRRRRAGIRSRVIYNGVDLDTYSPTGEGYESPRDLTVLLVEANITRSHEPVLAAVVEAVERVARSLGASAELLCLGQVDPSLRARFAEGGTVRFAGQVNPREIPYYQRGADAFISLDINAACPNSVIEALACGTPVVGFATGALPELVPNAAGVCAPYGQGSPWSLEPPDFASLGDGLRTVLEQREAYAAEARRVAEERFSLDDMVDAYLEAVAAAAAGPVSATDGGVNSSKPAPTGNR